MAFVDQQQRVLENVTLRLATGNAGPGTGEDVTIDGKPVRAGISRRVQSSRDERPGFQSDPQDEREELLVTVTRREDYEHGGLPERPKPGAKLLRQAANDGDHQRPYVFRGGIGIETPWMAIYIFDRRRRVTSQIQ